MKSISPMTHHTSCLTTTSKRYSYNTLYSESDPTLYTTTVLTEHHIEHLPDQFTFDREVELPLPYASHYSSPIYLVSFDFDYLYNTWTRSEYRRVCLSICVIADYLWYTNWTLPKIYIHTFLHDTKPILLHLLHAASTATERLVGTYFRYTISVGGPIVEELLSDSENTSETSYFPAPDSLPHTWTRSRGPTVEELLSQPPAYGVDIRSHRIKLILPNHRTIEKFMT